MQKMAEWGHVLGDIWRNNEEEKCMGCFGLVKWERLSSLETALHQFDQARPPIGSFLTSQGVLFAKH